MEAEEKTIKRVLEEQGYPPTHQNILTVKDALVWREQEDYDTTLDAVRDAVEDESNELRR